MAMLAGPRRKQKVINLRAKNNAWSNDSGKFGQRMLEKMGWSEGKGLGAHENGIVDHVVARYKNDEKGLGFEDRNDQWTKHEDDFNSLLANLSNSGDDKDNKLHSGVSLEVKSKTSKARVHYHKFTRGKDLTRYSEKDLANIFGKKSLKNKEKPSEKPVVIQEENPTSEQVFTEKGSMEDYFKNKLAAFKTKTQFNLNKNYNDNADHGFKGFSGVNYEEVSENHQGFGFQSFSFDSTENDQNNSTTNENPENTVENIKPKKEKKKKVQTEEISEQNVDAQVSEIIEEPKKVKKSKKKHKEIEAPEELEESQIELEEQTNYVSKKKKKRKNKEKSNE